MVKKLVLAGLCAMILVPTAFAGHTNFKGYSFETNVVADDWGSFPEITRNGKPWLQVQPGSQYSIVIYNPLPVRVAAAVTIDGLNIIDGKRSSPEKAQKWMIDANSSITLRGWQTDQGSLRRFVFTDENSSYAEWKGHRDRKDYGRNLGVIGVAYFWNKAELEAALRPPEPFAGRSFFDGPNQEAAPATADEKKSEAAVAKSKAGTGMGEREANNVYEVEFHYNTGMYRSKDALAIYYEFASNVPRPQPFVDDEREHDRQFAPEMP